MVQTGYGRIIIGLSVLAFDIKANILNSVTDYKLQILFVVSDTVHLTPANCWPDD